MICLIKIIKLPIFSSLIVFLELFRVKIKTKTRDEILALVY